MQTTKRENNTMSKNIKKSTQITEMEKQNFLKENKVLPESKFSLVDKKEEDKKHKSPQKTSPNNFVRDLDQNLVLKQGIVLKRFADMVEECKFIYTQDRANEFFWVYEDIAISEDDMDKILHVQKKSIRNFYVNRKTDEPKFVAHIIRPSKIWKQEMKKLEENQETEIEEKVSIKALTEQLGNIQKQLSEVLSLNKMLLEQLQSKDLIIQELTKKIESLANVPSETLELRGDSEESLVTTEKVVEEAPVVSNETTLIEKFSDDGIRVNLNANEDTPLQQAMEVLENTIKLTPEQQSKVVNHGKRDVSSEKVSEVKYSETLVKDLKPSDQTIRVRESKKFLNKRSSTLIEFTPNRKPIVRRDPECPKGIMAVRWNQIKEETNIQEREKKIRGEYLRIFKIEFFVLQKRWLAVFPKKRNPYIVSYKLVWETLNKNTITDLWTAITKWKSNTQLFQLVKTPMTEDQKCWYKNQKD